MPVRRHLVCGLSATIPSGQATQYFLPACIPYFSSPRPWRAEALRRPLSGQKSGFRSFLVVRSALKIEPKDAKCVFMMPEGADLKAIEKGFERN